MTASWAVVAAACSEIDPCVLIRSSLASATSPDRHQSAYCQWWWWCSNCRGLTTSIRPNFAAFDSSMAAAHSSRQRASGRLTVGWNDRRVFDCVYSVSDSSSVPFFRLPRVTDSTRLSASPLALFDVLLPRQQFDAAPRRPWRLRPESS